MKCFKIATKAKQTGENRRLPFECIKLTVNGVGNYFGERGHWGATV